MSVLIDTSVWVAYFRGDEGWETLEELIDEGMPVTNELVLAELVPVLLVKKQAEVIALLREIPRISLRIEWDGIIKMHVKCLQNGINGVGIPDLIIAQNSIQNGMRLFSLDKHFQLMAEHFPLALMQ